VGEYDVIVQCSNCKAEIEVPYEWLGKKTTCTTCGEIFIIGDSDEEKCPIVTTDVVEPPNPSSLTKTRLTWRDLTLGDWMKIIPFTVKYSMDKWSLVRWVLMVPAGLLAGVGAYLGWGLLWALMPMYNFLSDSPTMALLQDLVGKGLGGAAMTCAAASVVLKKHKTKVAWSWLGTIIGVYVVLVILTLAAPPNGFLGKQIYSHARAAVEEGKTIVRKSERASKPPFDPDEFIARYKKREEGTKSDVNWPGAVSYLLGGIAVSCGSFEACRRIQKDAVPP